MSDSQGKGIYPVTVPKWGIEMQEGTITGWLVELGERVEKGKDLVDIETDKIVNTMESPATGILCRQLVGEGDTLKVGELLGVIATAEADEASIDAFVESFVPADASFGVGDDFPETPPASEEKSPEPAPGKPSDSGSNEQAVAVSPIARRLAEQLGVDLSKIKPSGRGGRISKEDVEQAAAQHAADAPKTDPETRAAEPKVTALSGRALTQARRMVEAKQNIPHFYLGREMDMRAALDAQQLLDVPLTSLIVQAVVRAIVDQPVMNAHFVNDGIHQLSSIGINIAIDTPDGLVAPLLPDLANSDAAEIAVKLKTLAERARARELKAEDLQPGSMTLSNLGMFGISQFSAIINPPQTSILAVGVVRPILMEMDGPMIPAMNATLSCDHRALDGAAGARFLQALQKSLLEI